MAQVVAKGDGFCQILIHAHAPGNVAGGLCHLQGVGQAGPVMVPQGREKDLCFVFKPPEGVGVYYAVPVCLEGCPDAAWLFVS